MKIRITTLPQHGLPLQFDLDRTLLNERLAEGRESDITFTTDPKADLLATPITGAVTVSGTVSSRVRQACAGCGTLIERELSVPIEWMLKPVTGIEGEEDDIGLYYYQGDHFDLEFPVAEACLLQLTPYWRPELTGDGPCTGCGSLSASANQTKPGTPPKTNSLAVALEKAKVAGASKRKSP